ncbi:MAG: hypothetical protein SFW09_14920 [Hyphomicrobiaceae bacterium]|nr:hypothetical protein [Hyphomicrobiaceae bacterium]
MTRKAIALAGVLSLLALPVATAHAGGKNGSSYGDGKGGGGGGYRGGGGGGRGTGIAIGIGIGIIGAIAASERAKRDRAEEPPRREKPQKRAQTRPPRIEIKPERPPTRQAKVPPEKPAVRAEALPKLQPKPEPRKVATGGGGYQISSATGGGGMDETALYGNVAPTAGAVVARSQ